MSLSLGQVVGAKEEGFNQSALRSCDVVEECHVKPGYSAMRFRQNETELDVETSYQTVTLGRTIVGELVSVLR